MFTIKTLNNSLDSVMHQITELARLCNTVTISDDAEAQRLDNIRALTKIVSDAVISANALEIKTANELIAMNITNGFDAIVEIANTTYTATVLKIVTDNDDADKNGIEIIQSVKPIAYRQLTNDNKAHFSVFDRLFDGFVDAVKNARIVSSSAVKKAVCKFVNCPIGDIAKGFSWLLISSVRATAGKKSVKVVINREKFNDGILTTIRALNNGITTVDYKVI